MNSKVILKDFLYLKIVYFIQFIVSIKTISLKFGATCSCLLSDFKCKNCPKLNWLISKKFKCGK